MKYFKHIDIGESESAIQEFVLENRSSFINGPYVKADHALYPFIASHLPALGMPSYMFLFRRGPGAASNMHIDGAKLSLR